MKSKSQADGTSSRAAMLGALRRRFSVRWKVGIVIGVLLVGVNWLGYRIVVNDVLERLSGDAEAATALRRMGEVNAALACTALIVLAALALIFFRPLDGTLAEESAWLEEVEESQRRDLDRRRFDTELHEALEMAVDEPGVTAVVEHVFERRLETRPAELKLADSSDSHLVLRAESPTAGAAGCRVASPFDCPAVRRARLVSFESSTAINACPHLRDRGVVCSATCVPLSFMGRSMGVLHVTGPVDEPLDETLTGHLVSLAAQTSTQLGTLRAFAKAQLQASTDGLTGLMNRRTAEDELGQWLERGEHFALAVVDLDRFKMLNDAHGHQAGDRALRLFSDTVRRTLRSRDLFARWGGEEFVVALAGVDKRQAVDTFDRIRLALVEACARAETPTVTASFGVIDTSAGGSLEALVRAADEALLHAKRTGRDRVVVGPVTLSDSLDANDALAAIDALGANDALDGSDAPDGDDTLDVHDHRTIGQPVAADR